MLDHVPPYLSLAVSAASLLAGVQQAQLSPSRLLFASWRLRTAPASCVLQLPHVRGGVRKEWVGGWVGG